MLRSTQKVLGHARSPYRLAAALPAQAGSSGNGQGQSGGYSTKTLAAVGAIGLLAGVAIGDKDHRLRQLQLPKGGFHMCAHCDMVLTDKQKALGDQLAGVVGSGNVKKNYTQKGSRIGEGTSLAYVAPGTLAEAVKVLKMCVAADVAVLPQGANTGLTGGSVPRDGLCDRPTVTINLRRLNKIMPVGSDGKHVLCFSGAGIYDLKELLDKDCNRDSHTILGSIFLNPSVAAGVAYGSGGTQIRKGPAFTERALYAKISETGEVEIVNTLGLKDGGDAVAFLDGAKKLTPEDLDAQCKAPGSLPDYANQLRILDKGISRSNADTSGIDCCRSEGKVMILATLHDTFEFPKKIEQIWVACKDYATAHEIRRDVCLKAPDTMAKSCEYMNKETVDGVDQAGRIQIKMIDWLGMNNLEHLWNLKLFIESIPLPFTNIICDKFLWWFNNVIPKPLPPVVDGLKDKYEHHMLMEFAEYTDGEIARLREALDTLAKSKPEGHVKYHTCEGWEATRVSLFRFVVASSFRTYVVGKGLQGISIDYALPKENTELAPMPDEKYPLVHRWTYAHLGCNVYHEDLIYGTDIDVHEAKHEVKHGIEAQAGGRLPAEHGHGTEYKAPKAAQERWMKMDPLNVMNPGVGGTSYNKNYSEKPAHL